jgi:hypothetical protein
MQEKINATKVAIVERIKKAVEDDSKSLSAETLMTMTDILNKLVPEDKPAVEKVNNEDNKETI